jgi:hypothetical protein
MKASALAAADSQGSRGREEVWDENAVSTVGGLIGDSVQVDYATGR